jgi:hypothetical protein
LNIKNKNKNIKNLSKLDVDIETEIDNIILMTKKLENIIMLLVTNNNTDTENYKFKK